MLHLIKGVPNTKKQAFRQHVVNNQKSYAAAIGQKTLTQPKTPQTFQFTAEQLTKFVANVVIQIAQPQVCYPNPKQDTLDLKSSMCRKISNAAKSVLSIDITGKELSESIGSLSAPASPPPPPPPSIYIYEHKGESSLQNHHKPSIFLKSISQPNKPTKAAPKQPSTSK